MATDQEAAFARLRVARGQSREGDVALLAAAGPHSLEIEPGAQRDLRGRVRVRDVVTGRRGWAHLAPVDWDDEQPR